MLKSRHRQTDTVDGNAVADFSSFQNLMRFYLNGTGYLLPDNTLSGNATIDTILEERAVEFCGEQMRVVRIMSIWLA